MQKDLTNLTFGRLKVIKNVGTNKYGFALWECLCECGNTVIITSRNLISGHTKSCGCYSYECKKDKSIKYRKYAISCKNDRLYRLYRGIIQRTTTLRKDNHNHTYIEKNVKICDEWRNDFNKFKEWALANGYDYSKNANEQTIDRIDNDKGYNPGNCRFVSRKENNKNESKKRGIVCLSKEQQNEIKKLYKNGFSSRKLAQKYKVSKTTIMNIIKALTRKELENETSI